MKEYHTKDKSEWADGPWKQEPDKLSWTDETTGYPCLIKRNIMGALCGYVGVPPEHKYYQEKYSNDLSVDVHGGLTYAGPCQEGPEKTSICHIPEQGQPDKVWWLGFDCNHAFDYAPKMSKYSVYPIVGEFYKDISYVRNEVLTLAKQLKSIT